MATRDDDWSHITDINERRKAQNRIAQRNYRSRQRMRIELAEAILFDLPHLKSAAAQQRWNETSSNSGSNTRSRTPELFDTPYQNDSTVDFLDVSGLEDFESPSASANGLDCIDATLNPANTQITTTQTALRETSTSQTQSQKQNQPQLQLPTTNTICEIRATQNGHSSTPPTSQSQAQTHNSPSDAFSCLTDFNDPIHSTDSVALSTVDSIGTPPSLKVFTPPSSTTSSCSSILPNDTITECTPLLSAVMRGNIEIARLLIKGGGKVDAKNQSEKTALHLAVERGDTVAARTLLDLGADITIPDDSGTSVFHRAIIRDDIEQLRALLKWCEEKSRLRQFEGLLKRCIGLKDAQKKTLVHLAVVLERIDILKLLLEFGADVNE
ncbi:ankyrin repeat protein [Colletotrichum truncatum]|uniref:Ankyrin repeat protein n=1 Tax=Colletotrichum truncatum TaxID=5467 RepID=A0ACC3YVG5_COLTU|nr:ankyrin repeat protein [Colletotrichum truncatum]KAF6786412.1 ankyrin repeat protein [Colletotrichum truncatum]